jgi:D-alanine transaminase
MSRIVYVNGRFVREENAKISVFDRGFLFADGVYEVTAVVGGKLVDYEGHVDRLYRSMGELKLRLPVTRERLLAIHRTLVKRNGLDEGGVYLEVTRGAADRDFTFPPEETEPTLVLFTQARQLVANPDAETGIAVISLPDIRWARRDIKTVGLLAQALAKQAAKEKGAKEAWMVEGEEVTEGGSSTAWIVTEGGEIVTRPNSRKILPGITRASLQRLAAEHQIKVVERVFTLSEAKAAKEAFITSATSFVMPVVSIDGQKVGEGRPGRLVTRLREIYVDEMRRAAI